jgi:energy-coupling factor transport system permease protein
MLIYREKDNLIHRLHPFTIIMFIGVVFFLSLVFSHPVYLLGLLIAVGAVITAAGNFQEWKIYLKFGFIMIILIMFINVIMVHAGDTVLISGPRVPVIGSLNITLEALVFGAGMGIRLFVIISVFCLYTYSVHPDKILKLFSSCGNKSILIITLATRLFPLMVRDYFRITEVQRCRGVKIKTGGWWKRVKNFLPIVSVMLISSLERSLQLAESMHARGYGSGKRISYNREFWRPRDYLILAALTISLGCGVWTAISGWSTCSYYPKLPETQIYQVDMACFLVFLLLMPAILNWGWKKWPILKSKI